MSMVFKDWDDPQSVFDIWRCFLYFCLDLQTDSERHYHPAYTVYTGRFFLNRLLTEKADLSYDQGGLHTLAELTLILVLAADASKISLSKLKSMSGIPMRLLGIALPLIIATGTLVGIVLFPEYPWYLAALIAAILAPTDAALGASVLTDKSLPLDIRQGLTVESGLNDGIALTAVLFSPVS